MAVPAGTRLGPYEILSALGAVKLLGRHSRHRRALTAIDVLQRAAHQRPDVHLTVQQDVGRDALQSESSSSTLG